MTDGIYNVHPEVLTASLGLCGWEVEVADLSAHCLTPLPGAPGQLLLLLLLLPHFCSGLAPWRWLPLATLEMELQDACCRCCCCVSESLPRGPPAFFTGAGAGLTDILPQTKVSRKLCRARCWAGFPGFLTSGRPSLGLEKEK